MNEWIIEENGINPSGVKKYESIACQGNGYMGVRNSLEEEYIYSHRNTFINGVFNAPMDEVAELASLPDVTNFECFINGERFFLDESKVRNYKRFLDMQTGEGKRTFVWTTKDGIDVGFEFYRFVSVVKKHIVAQKIVIKCEKDINVEVKTGIDGKITNTGVQHFGVTYLRSFEGNIIGLNTKTQQSGVDVSAKSHVKCDCNCKRAIDKDRRSIFVCLSFAIEAGKAVELEKISAYATSRDYECEASAEHATNERADLYLKEAIKKGYCELFKENVQNWQKYWNENGIRIKSDNTFYQKAINFALYHLRIMTNGEDRRLGIGAKALTGEGYKGHSFWDTEIFIFPHYAYTQPKAARKLLEYRYLLLEESRKKAKEYGFCGAMYPWEGAWYTDGENCPQLGEPDVSTGEQRPMQMGEIEVHINADIVYAVWQYYNITQDDDFMEKYGCEIVLSTALFWISRMTERNGRFEILNVIGPDEYKENIDNNTYTNYMAHFNLKFASDILKGEYPFDKSDIKNRVDIKMLEDRLSDVLERIYLPNVDDDGIIPQFDGFSDLKQIDVSPYKSNDKVALIFRDYSFSEIEKMRVCKQADMVMLFYLFRDLFDNKTVRDNLKYYEACTLHDSSLSMCIHSLVASRTGDMDMAEKLFYDCCCVDLGDKSNNSDNGIHSASIGGIWLSVVMGFGGVSVSDGALKIEPVLPDGIEEYSFPVEYMGTRILITVNKDGADVVKMSGKSMELFINNTKKKLL